MTGRLVWLGGGRSAELATAEARPSTFVDRAPRPPAPAPRAYLGGLARAAALKAERARAAAILAQTWGASPASYGLGTLSEIAADGCRWPVGEDARGHVFCGARASARSSYCARHRAVAHAPEAD